MLRHPQGREVRLKKDIAPEMIKVSTSVTGVSPVKWRNIFSAWRGR